MNDREDYYPGPGMPPEESQNTQEPESVQKPKKPLYKRWWFWVLAICGSLYLITGVYAAVNGKPDGDATRAEETKKNETNASGWRSKLSPKLVAEIEAAFEEIGENPDNIISVTYVDKHTSGYVFEQKCYKVEFDWSFGKPGYKHSRYYRIVTQNYFEGEPEKAQHPNEFLCTIKYWAGDDGHGTNVNQWSHTGNGDKQ
jgi:hypothetical protein